MSKFKHLHIPDTWQQYWSRYPQGYTIVESLINWVSQVDEMVDNINDWNKYLDEFVLKFDKELQSTITNTLREWQESGFLDIVIDQALETKYHEMDERLTSQMANLALQVNTNGTDDTTAINEAISELASNGGGTLLLPDEEYLLTHIDIVNTQNIKIMSNGGVLRQTTAQKKGFININNSKNIIIRGLKLEGQNIIIQEKTGYEYHGIMIVKSENITIENSEIYNMVSGGILATDSTKITIKNNYLHHNNDMFDIAFGYSIPSIPLEEAWIENNICHSQNRYGIHVQGYGKNVNITGNHVKDKHEYGIMVYRLDETTIGGNVWENVVVSNNIVEEISDNPNQNLSYRSGMGIYLQTATKVVCNNNVVRNVLKNRTETPTFRTLLPGAIAIGGSREVTCVGNLIDGSLIDGIAISTVEKENLGSVVADNTILNVGEYGIDASGTNNVNITGNIIRGNNALVGVVCRSTASVITDNISISNNNIVTGFGTGINVTKGPGTAIRDISVTNNKISDCTSAFIIAENVSLLKVDGNTVRAKTRPQGENVYAINITACSDITVHGNIAQGSTMNKFYGGISVANSNRGTVSMNVLRSVVDVANSLRENNNTDIYFYLNQTDRQPMPVMDEYMFGVDLPQGNSRKVTYGEAPPANGTYDKGSICWNINPTNGGNVGWVCTAYGSPGTWKPFGTIGE